MKALVCVKRVVDYAVKIRVQQDKKGVEIKDLKLSINPFCEIAVEEGIRLKEKGMVDELVTLSIGAEKCQETLRQTLAMGADRSILLQTDMRTDQDIQPLAVAKLIKEIIEKEKPELVILGKQSIDDDANQTGQLLAGLLGWPQATFASKVEIDADKKSMTIEREVDAGIQTMTSPIPAVITADLRLNEPRYAKLPNLMKAKKKPLEKIPIEDILPMDVLAPRLKTLEVTDPPKRSGGATVGSVDELIDKLKNEAKVL